MKEFLATAVLQALAVQHTFAYAYLRSDLTIADCSDNLVDFLEMPLLQIDGQLITAVLAELIGVEAHLLAVLNREVPFYRLWEIDRTQPDGFMRYMSLQVTAVAPPQTGLLLLIEDTTEVGRLKQQLEQAQNTLHLLRNKASKKP